MLAAGPHEAASSKDSLLVLETSKARKLKEQLVGRSHPTGMQKDKRRWTSSNTPQGPGAYPAEGGKVVLAPTTTQSLSFVSRLFSSSAEAPHPSDHSVVKRQRQWSWSRFWRWRKRSKPSHETVIHVIETTPGTTSSSAWPWRSLQSKDSAYISPPSCSSHHHQPHNHTTFCNSKSGSCSKSSAIRPEGEVILRPSGQSLQHRQQQQQRVSHANTLATVQACQYCHRHSAEVDYTYQHHPLAPGVQWPTSTYDKYGIGTVASVFFAFWNSQPEWFRFGMFIAFAILSFMLLTTLLVMACSLHKGMSVIGVVAYGLDDLVRGCTSFVQRLIGFFAGR
ncbi:hypothetical protein BGW41_002654 [Actinomortierella wolfii]|nr:hypothetical protein BGW41_002654 [Actinomortierella wolfii]